jgi:hypothetical protein
MRLICGYADTAMWEVFLDMAMEYLKARQDRLQSEFALGTWKRYDYDQNIGTLTFSSEGKVGVIADMYVVGTTSKNSGTWLWSWCNPWILGRVKHCMQDVREYGEVHGLEKLTTAEWPGDERDGWEMTAAAAFILKAEGAYRAPDGDGALFMILRNVRRCPEYQSS